MPSIVRSLGKMKFITLNREVHKWAGIVLSVGVLVITVTGFALLHDKSWTWLKRTEVPAFLIPAWSLEGEKGKAKDVKALATTTGGGAAGPLVVGTKAGLYQGNAAGVKPMALPAGQTEVTALLLGGERWLVGTPRGLFSSTDRGSSWDMMSEGPWSQSTRTKVNTLAADPVSPQMIYAGTKMGLYRSTNGGVNWENLSERTEAMAAETGEAEDMEKAREVMTIAFEPNQSATVLVGTHRGLYRYDAQTGAFSSIEIGAALAGMPAAPMTLAKYLNDLHTGKLFAHKLWIVYDLIALGLVLFVATGLYIWVYPKSVKWKKEREQARAREARPVAPATVTGDRPLPHRG
ncbi:MAG: PepSY domain-containing protein [Nitrospira defluvii]|nr:PepSY domain-containing protein [Nitrospira defluvii]